MSGIDSEGGVPPPKACQQRSGQPVPRLADHSRFFHIGPSQSCYTAAKAAKEERQRQERKKEVPCERPHRLTASEYAEWARKNMYDAEFVEGKEEREQRLAEEKRRFEEKVEEERRRREQRVARKEQWRREARSKAIASYKEGGRDKREGEGKRMMSQPAKTFFEISASCENTQYSRKLDSAEIKEECREASPLSEVKPMRESIPLVLSDVKEEPVEQWAEQEQEKLWDNIYVKREVKEEVE